MLTSSYESTQTEHQSLSPDLQAYFEAMVNHVIVVSDAHTSEVYFTNAALEKILGYSRSQFYTKNIAFLYALIHPEDNRGFKEKLQQLPQTGAFTTECRVRHAAGHWIWMEARLLTTLSPGGLPSKVIGTWVDITDRKTQEFFLQQEIMAWDKLFGQNKSSDRLDSTSHAAIRHRKTASAPEPKLLSIREIEVLKLVARGYSSKMIAETLHISWHTANSHRKNILAKLNVRNSAELVNQAARYL